MIDTGWQYAPVTFFVVTLTRRLTVASGTRPVMVARPAALGGGRHRSWSRLARAGVVLGARLRSDLLQEAAAMEGFDARAPEASHPEGEALQR